MLILARRQDEAIVIEGKITIVVNEIVGDTVRIGIHAPREMSVLRGELYERNTGKKPPGRETERTRAPAGQRFQERKEQRRQQRRS